MLVNVGSRRVPVVVAAVCLWLCVAYWAGAGGVTFWNRLEGGAGSVPSEVGPSLYPWDQETDGGTGANDAVGNPVYVPGRFGNALTLGPGDYYPQARVHGLVLRDLSAVLNAERGTIAVWYKEKQRPTPFEHNLYKLFDGGFGLDAPVQLANNGADERGNLYLIVVFGGEQNWVNAPFSPALNEWVHVAAVWDRAGIDGTGETARLYVDGVKVAAIATTSWGTGLGANHADIAGGGDLMDDKFALDNLVVYDYAKTDFSDRFNENPLASSRSYYIATSAHSTGALGTNWRTDVEVHNPGAIQAAYTIALLAHDTDNSHPLTRTYTLAPGSSVRYPDIVLDRFGFAGKGALRITTIQGEILATSSTYNRLGAGNPLGVPDGSTFGEFVPAVAEENATAATGEGRLIQLSHTDPSLKTGFRTNVGVVNAGPAAIKVVVDLYTVGGTLLGTVRRTLPPYGYHQFDSVLAPWAGAPIDDAWAVVRCTTAGGRFFAYASVVDNRTGAPIFIPALHR